MSAILEFDVQSKFATHETKKTMFSAVLKMLTVD